MKNGTLIINNIGGHVSIVFFGDANAISAALAVAGKRHPEISIAISSAAVELDNYLEALKTGEALRKMIEDEKEEK